MNWPKPTDPIWREYEAAAEHYARTGELPACMGSPGAIDLIDGDPEAFYVRVRAIRYGNAMRATCGGAQRS